LKLYNSPADYARELFKPSKDAASVVNCIGKNWKVLDFRFFVGEVISTVDLGHFGSGYPALDTKH